MNESKQNKLIIKRLLSNNTDEVLFTINKLRNTGNKSLIPYLIDILASHKSIKVKESVINLLYDLKYQSAAEEIIKAIKSDKYIHIREELLAVCWQSSLDFSNYIDVFTEKFIKGNFKESFEAFTAIENIEKKLDAELAENSIAALKDVINNIEENKKELLIELVHILESKERFED
jgi:HEAT repeat protein